MAHLWRHLTAGGPEGNERLTAVTAVVLLVLLAVEGITIVLIGRLIWGHLFVGMLLIGPIALKLASTGYRFARYYGGNGTYRRKGPPPMLLRMSAPILVLTSVLIVVSGVILLFAGTGVRDTLLPIHKVSFFVWLAFMSLHVLAHLPGMPRALRADYGGRERAAAQAEGRPGRELALSGSLLAGVAIALISLPQFGPWLHFRRDRHDDGGTETTGALGTRQPSGASTTAKAAGNTAAGNTPKTAGAATAAVSFSSRPLGTLPAPVQDPAAALLPGGGFVLIGGLDAADTSAAAITAVTGGHGHTVATLKGAQHDAQATTIGGAVYVFGGGDLQTYDHILRYDPGAGTVTQVGSLPLTQSDVGVTALGNTAYVVGGYDGRQALDTIVAWHPGGSARVVGHLPRGLRYAAVTAAGGQVIVAGGSEDNGNASDAIYTFNPTTTTVRELGHLPTPLTHAGVATLGGTVYLVGGRSAVVDTPTRTILAIDPLTGATRRVGLLPRALSDAAVLPINGAIVVAGGRTATATQSTITELRPSGAARR